MQFSIHTTGRANLKFKVPARHATLIGVWSEPDKDILCVDQGALIAGLPYRYRKAYRDRRSGFWYDNEARWDGEQASHGTAHATLRDAKGREMLTIYAIPCN